MKIEETRFGFDKEGNPCLMAKCRIDIEETSGKFRCGFGLARDRKTGELYLFAFREHTDNPIAVLTKKENVINWIEKVLEKNGYKWYHLYVSGVEKVNGWYAFMVPFDAEGWNELPNDVRQEFEKMLNLLKT